MLWIQHWMSTLNSLKFIYLKQAQKSNHLLLIWQSGNVPFLSLTCLLLRHSSILTFEGKYPFPLKVVKERLHANRKKTDLEAVREGLTADIQSLCWLSCPFQFSDWVSFYKISMGGTCQSVCCPPSSTIFSRRPGTLCFQHSMQPKYITNTIYVAFHQALRHVTLIIM